MIVISNKLGFEILIDFLLLLRTLLLLQVLLIVPLRLFENFRVLWLVIPLVVFHRAATIRHQVSIHQLRNFIALSSRCPSPVGPRRQVQSRHLLKIDFLYFSFLFHFFRHFFIEVLNIIGYLFFKKIFVLFFGFLTFSLCPFDFIH